MAFKSLYEYDAEKDVNMLNEDGRKLYAKFIECIAPVIADATIERYNPNDLICIGHAVITGITDFLEERKVEYSELLEGVELEGPVN
jgi:hypothetical protein